MVVLVQPRRVGGAAARRRAAGGAVWKRDVRFGGKPSSANTCVPCLTRAAAWPSRRTRPNRCQASVHCCRPSRRGARHLWARRVQTASRRLGVLLDGRATFCALLSPAWRPSTFHPASCHLGPIPGLPSTGQVSAEFPTDQGCSAPRGQCWAALVLGSADHRRHSSANGALALPTSALFALHVQHLRWAVHVWWGIQQIPAQCWAALG